MPANPAAVTIAAPPFDAVPPCPWDPCCVVAEEAACGRSRSLYLRGEACGTLGDNNIFAAVLGMPEAVMDAAERGVG